MTTLPHRVKGESQNAKRKTQMQNAEMYRAGRQYTGDPTVLLQFDVVNHAWMPSPFAINVGIGEEDGLLVVVVVLTTAVSESG